MSRRGVIGPVPRFDTTMQDLALNSDLSVHLDDTNDFAVVDDRAAFEQSVMIQLTRLQQGAIAGVTKDATTEQKIRFVINRVVDDHEMVDEVESINIADHPERPDTYAVNIQYTTDTVFDDMVTMQ